MIRALYRASQAGVEIDLIVRGQCALVPGRRGISSRIRVRSIVGRFLEHSRIFYCENGEDAEVYLGSADWMPWNLYERVEVLFPVKDSALWERMCREILPYYLADTRKGRNLRQDGLYTHLRKGRRSRGFSVQEHLMKRAHVSVNGSGTCRGPQLAANYSSQHEAWHHPLEPRRSAEFEVEESANATV